MMKSRYNMSYMNFEKCITLAQMNIPKIAPLFKMLYEGLFIHYMIIFIYAKILWFLVINHLFFTFKKAVSTGQNKK